MSSGITGKRRGLVLAGVTIVSLAVTLPLALTSERRASAGALVTARERTNVLDALRTTEVLAVRAADPSGDDARLAIDGRVETAWTGRPGELQWKWAASLARPVHLGLVRARFGTTSTSGVPTAFHWETRLPSADGRQCAALPATTDDGWEALDAADQAPSFAGDQLAQPTRRSWFVDADACAIRLVIDRTNAGPPVVREVQAIESARDVLREGQATSDATYPGFVPQDAIDGSYARRWAGGAGKSRWTLRVNLQTRSPSTACVSCSVSTPPAWLDREAGGATPSPGRPCTTCSKSVRTVGTSSLSPTSYRGPTGASSRCAAGSSRSASHETCVRCSSS